MGRFFTKDENPEAPRVPFNAIPVRVVAVVLMKFLLSMISENQITGC